MTRLYIIAAFVAAFLVAAGGLYVKGRGDAAAKYKPQVEAAQTQTKVEQATTQALDHYTHETVVIRERSDRAVETVQRAQGADAPVPPDVLSAWRDGLRDGASQGADHDPRKSPGIL